VYCVLPRDKAKTQFASDETYATQGPSVLFDATSAGDACKVRNKRNDLIARIETVDV